MSWFNNWGMPNPILTMVMTGGGGNEQCSDACGKL